MDEMTPFMNVKLLLTNACSWLRNIVNSDSDFDISLAIDEVHNIICMAIRTLHDAGFEAVEDGGEEIPEHGWSAHFKNVAYRPEAKTAEKELRVLATPIVALFDSEDAIEKTAIDGSLIEKLNLFLPGKYMDAFDKERAYLDVQSELCD